MTERYWTDAKLGELVQLASLHTAAGRLSGGETLAIVKLLQVAFTNPGSSGAEIVAKWREPAVNA